MTDAAQARSEAMHAAITKVFHDHADHESDRGMVSRFVLVVEQVSNDGDPWFRVLSEAGSVAWHRMGLLSYALANQQAVATAEEVRGDA